MLASGQQRTACCRLHACPSHGLREAALLQHRREIAWSCKPQQFISCDRAPLSLPAPCVTGEGSTQALNRSTGYTAVP